MRRCIVVACAIALLASAAPAGAFVTPGYKLVRPSRRAAILGTFRVNAAALGVAPKILASTTFTITNDAVEVRLNGAPAAVSIPYEITAERGDVLTLTLTPPGSTKTMPIDVRLDGPDVLLCRAPRGTSGPDVEWQLERVLP